MHHFVLIFLREIYHSLSLSHFSRFVYFISACLLSDDPTGNTFFFYDPDHMFPFVTLVTTDYNDSFSDLNRPSVFRLNIGVSKQTYISLFGSRQSQSSPSGEGDAGGGDADGSDAGDGGYDFTALDQLMPHPVYGRMYWVCVLNPSDATFETVVRPLLAEAYEMAVSKYAKRAAHRGG